DDSAGRARENRVRRAPPSLICRHRPSARAHDQEPSPETAFGERLFQPLDVVPEDRPNVSIQNGRARALVLAVLTSDLEGDGHLQVRVERPDDLGSTAFVL